MYRHASTTAQYTMLDQRLMQKAERYFAWQAGMALKQAGQRVIEVGCGTGNFTRHLLDRELVVGLDVVEDCVDHLLERLGNPANVEAMVLDIQDRKFLDLKHFKADTIVCLNVLEHIRDQRLALQHMEEVLSPGGRAIFLLPAFEALYGPIDENLGHFRRYSKSGWQSLAESAGFKVRLSRYFNFPGFFAWWANAKVLKKTRQSAPQIDFFDSIVVPLTSKVESWIEPPVGQSIFTVLEKRPA
jgi:SAM-dependent methyltransferase